MMKLLTAAVLVAPIFATALPVEAATANQYRLQGQGVYTSSKGHVTGYRGGYGGYGYRPYGYRPYGYRPYGYRPYGFYPHHRRGYRPYY